MACPVFDSYGYMCHAKVVRQQGMVRNAQKPDSTRLRFSLHDLSRRLQQLMCRAQRAFADFAKHLRKFKQARLAFKRFNARERATFIHKFLHLIMLVAKDCELRQMCDAKNLMRARDSKVCARRPCPHVRQCLDQFHRRSATGFHLQRRGHSSSQASSAMFRRPMRSLPAV